MERRRKGEGGMRRKERRMGDEKEGRGEGGKRRRKGEEKEGREEWNGMK